MNIHNETDTFNALRRSPYQVVYNDMVYSYIQSPIVSGFTQFINWSESRIILQKHGWTIDEFNDYLSNRRNADN